MGTGRPSQAGSTSARQARRSMRLRSTLAARALIGAAEQHDLDAFDRVGDVMLQFLDGRQASGAEVDAGEDGGRQRQADKEGGQRGLGAASAVGGGGGGRVHACGPRSMRNGLLHHRPAVGRGCNVFRE